MHCKTCLAVSRLRGLLRNEDGNLLILETKGMYLCGSNDMTYKQNLRATFRMAFEDTWPEQVHELVLGQVRYRRTDTVARSRRNPHAGA